MKVAEKLRTHIVYSKKKKSENCTVYEEMWKKYCTARQATDDSMVHTHCMLDT